ncbi:MAG: hypothetical protein E6G12_10740 [Actinobacteria bacterium]|nr:MAG: hypothetical protein E6G12_10740 [Actinomycetota bacterium]
MGFLDRIRNALAGPPHVDDSDRDEGPEIDAAMAEDFGAPDKGAADVRRMETTAGGAVMPGKAGAEAAEAAEADLASEEAPPDPNP